MSALRCHDPLCSPPDYCMLGCCRLSSQTRTLEYHLLVRCVLQQPTMPGMAAPSHGLRFDIRRVNVQKRPRCGENCGFLEQPGAVFHNAGLGYFQVGYYEDWQPRELVLHIFCSGSASFHYVCYFDLPACLTNLEICRELSAVLNLYHTKSV